MQTLQKKFAHILEQKSFWRYILAILMQPWFHVIKLLWNYLPRCWVDLNSNSKGTVDFFLLQNKNKVNVHPPVRTQVNSALGQIIVTIDCNQIGSKMTVVWRICKVSVPTIIHMLQRTTQRKWIRHFCLLSFYQLFASFAAFFTWWQFSIKRQNMYFQKSWKNV